MWPTNRLINPMQTIHSEFVCFFAQKIDEFTMDRGPAWGLQTGLWVTCASGPFLWDDEVAPSLIEEDKIGAWEIGCTSKVLPSRRPATEQEHPDNWRNTTTGEETESDRQRRIWIARLCQSVADWRGGKYSRSPYPSRDIAYIEKFREK